MDPNEIDYSFLDRDHKAAILEAREIVNAKPFYIDSETTGLGPDAEICDLAIVDHDGAVILSTLIRPSKPIPADATAKHGITNEMVIGAPRFADVWPLVKALFWNERPIVAYNAEFDARLLRQSYAAAGLLMPATVFDCFKYRCAMLLFSQFYGDWHDFYRSYKWKRLSLAAQVAGYPEWKEHRALGDTLAARAVMIYMAGQKLEDENART